MKYIVEVDVTYRLRLVHHAANEEQALRKAKNEVGSWKNVTSANAVSVREATNA